jgi:hypothetical protein
MKTHRCLFVPILAMLIIIGVMEACKPAPSPTIVPSYPEPANIETPSLPPTTYPASNSISSKRILVSFAMDRSLSMDRYCSGAQREILWNLIKAFQFVGSQAVQQNYLYFSLQVFPPEEGMTSTIVIEPITVSEFLLPQALPNIIQTERNEYAQAISDATEIEKTFTFSDATEIEKTFTFDEQAIILLTDGTFSKGNEESEKTEITDAISCLKPAEEKKIYLVICNQNDAFDQGWWQNRVNRTYNIRNLWEWLPGFVEKITGISLSSSLQTGGWFTRTTEISLPDIPGDAKQVKATLLLIMPPQGQYKYRLFPGGDYLLEQDPSWGNLYTTGEIPLHPSSDCASLTEQIKLPEENTGIYVVEIEYPQPSLLITPTISVNNEPVTIQLQLTGVPPEWAFCYRVKFDPAEGEVTEGSGKFDESSRTIYKWKPQEIDQPRLVTGTILLANQQGEISKADTVSVEVRFKPKIEGVELLEVKPGPLWNQEQLIYKFPAKYLPGFPAQLFLCSSKSPDEIRRINEDPKYQTERGKDDAHRDLTCPVPETRVSQSFPYCYKISVKDEEPLSALQPAIIYLQETYYLKTYRFMREQCDYHTAVFNWSENRGTIPITWICPLGGKGSCSEENSIGER